MLLPDMVDQAQSAFVKGRKISDNVLLAQDLLRDYHKSSRQPRVAAKVDIMKAYDSVSWEFLIDMLDVLGFPPNLKKWLVTCITSPKYSINFNGESVGFFAGAKGLRQGDPISPYLFVLVMDTLSQLLHHNISNTCFKYHWKCEKLHISHLCFADDLLILFKGDVASATVVRQTLNHFYLLTGLQANNAKSCLFFSNVEDDVVANILTTLNFVKGTLPIRYLGIPLITSRLKQRDCDELVNKICSRVNSWKSKFLSYAGRAQLISSVLTGIQLYWSGMFILPKSVLKLVAQTMSRFLWAGNTVTSYGAKIAWDKVCRPKKEGGLGFKDIFLTNTVLNLKHIGSLLDPSNKSLWKHWIQMYMMKNKSFWQVKTPAQCSWYWRKLLKLRPIAKPLLIHFISNGDHTYLWYDNWLPVGPLLDRYPERIAYDVAININAKVNSIIRDLEWDWPVSHTIYLDEV